MGHIHENHGLITIETHRESFTIHAGYGYRQVQGPVSDKRPGTVVLGLDGCEWKVHAHYEDYVTLVQTDNDTTTCDVAPDFVVLVDGEEEVDDTDPLGKLWRNYPHPEFANEDIDNLIAALIVVLKQNLSPKS
jgi:hypothetical protein